MRNYREILATMAFALWSYMVIMNPHEPLIVGAMITIISGSIVSFYYGNSKTDKPVDVKVTNPSSDPVPVERAGGE